MKKSTRFVLKTTALIIATTLGLSYVVLYVQGKPWVRQKNDVMSGSKMKTIGISAVEGTVKLPPNAQPAASATLPATTKQVSTQPYLRQD